jgi:hypothetical protein
LVRRSFFFYKDLYLFFFLLILLYFFVFRFIDQYVKDLASKTPKTRSLNTQSKDPTSTKVSPTRPLSSSAISPSRVSTEERKVGTLHGPRSPPNSKRSSLSAITSPRASVFNNNIKENNNNSSSNEINSTPIIEHTTNDTISNNSTKSPNTSNINEKKSKYNNLDDIVNDLSYPMETKLSFKPTTATNTTTATNATTATNTTTTPSPPQSKGNNNTPSPKGADDKGSYVASAAFRSSYSAASRTPSIKKPVIQPSPKQEQREIASIKKQRDSAIQELQNRSDTNWSARYDEAQQKYPPLNKFEKDKELPSPPSSTSSPPPPPLQDKNNVTAGEPLTPSPSNNRQTARPTSTLNCASCGKPISGNVLSAMGKKWHPDHFACKKCGITLEHVAFFEKDGDPYCHLDFHELFSPRCGYCETPIEGVSF